MSPSPSSLPWYRQFWPWFIIALLGSSVAAGIATVAIAVANQDSLVRDDYYREGVAINRRLSSDRAARELGIGATVRIEGESVEIELWGEGVEELDTLVLDLSHSTLEERDRVVWLARTAEARPAHPTAFAGTLGRAGDRAGDGRFYATLRPEATAWRLSRTVELPARGVLAFGTAE